MIKKSTSSGVTTPPELLCKSNDDLPSTQVNSIVLPDLANPKAVQAEIGDVLQSLDDVIIESQREVLERQGADTLKYSMTGMFATDLNATIKAKIFRLMSLDPGFANKVRVKYNYGSPFFIIKDKYAVFIKKLSGRQNKPMCYPTFNSIRTFSGNLFGTAHIPFLFVGPNLKKGEGSYVTSLIARNEVNWTSSTTDLFNYQENEVVNIREKADTSSLENVEINANILKIKKRATN